jgi:hypothetical protein
VASGKFARSLENQQNLLENENKYFHVEFGDFKNGNPDKAREN